MDSATEDLSSDASSGTIQVLKDWVYGRISWINTMRLADPIDGKVRGNSLPLPNHVIHNGVHWRDEADAPLGSRKLPQAQQQTERDQDRSQIAAEPRQQPKAKSIPDVRGC